MCCEELMKWENSITYKVTKVATIKVGMIAEARRGHQCVAVQKMFNQDRSAWRCFNLSSRTPPSKVDMYVSAVVHNLLKDRVFQCSVIQTVRLQSLSYLTSLVSVYIKPPEVMQIISWLVFTYALTKSIFKCNFWTDIWLHFVCEQYTTGVSKRFD